MSIRAFAYRANDVAVHEVQAYEIRRLLDDSNVTMWIDVEGQGPEEERALSELFNLHSLVIEDIFSDSPHPKVEDFGHYLYVVVHGIDRNAEKPEELNTLELDLILGERFVLTHRSAPMRSTETVEAELKRSPRLLQKGASFLAHSILDHITDHYLPVMDRFDEEIEELESKIMTDPHPSMLEQIFDLKRSLQRVRRVALHQKEILQRLSRGEFDLVDRTALPFYRDVYDHFVRVADLTDSYRDLVAASLEIYLSMQSQRLNEVMKVLTLISTIMLPLTFIAGVYGMNFDFMPELHWKYGYAFALGLMFVIAIGLYTFFKTRRWI